MHHFVAEERDTMTNESFRGDAVRSGESSSQPNHLRRLPAFGRSLAGIALCLISLWAQGATDFPDAPAQAPLPRAPVSVSPAQIELSARTPTIVVTVHNDNPLMAMVVLLQPMIWTEDGIAPHYASTADVIVTPATLTVAPGTTQAVQVELQSTAASLSGRDFQLFWQARAEPWSSNYKSDDRAAP
jgi:hypothetical protein